MLDGCWIVRMTAVLSVVCPAFSEAQFSLRKRRDFKSGYKGITLRIQRTTTDNETASIYCPDLRNEEKSSFNLSLHKIDINSTAMTSLKPSHRLHLSIEKNTFLIKMLQVNHTGLYCCGVWPDRTAYTLLLVEESHSCVSEGKPLSWIMLAAGCGLFALYNLIVTTVACYFGRKLKNAETETQSEYYNTRPGEFRRAR
ncbi:hypothetical protein AMEX_G14498 [Astyanax mexicanus]|uniref:Immunoglobulin V-set domain-containing protein n=1 Tax=Astyanax mexicanus TaxID=7994 RepID=A0A8T2LRW4_ASTMX|nr:hypothetical protein AMEX_G14498 [Astyanax mexicanus]